LLFSGLERSDRNDENPALNLIKSEADLRAELAATGARRTIASRLANDENPALNLMYKSEADLRAELAATGARRTIASRLAL